MGGKFWTPAEERKARALARQGYGMADVAAELGRARCAVRDRQRKAGGFGFRRGPEPDAGLRSDVIEAVNKGCGSAAEVCRMLGGRSESRFRLIVRQLVRYGLLTRTAGRLSVGRKWGREPRGGLS